MKMYDLPDMLVGFIGGSIGEVSALLLILGGCYLVFRKIITWYIPLSYIGTDYVTSPVSHLGQVIFGVGCGLLTVFIRYFGSYNEGVCYAILVMNMVVWMIDKSIKPARFGVFAEPMFSFGKKKDEEKEAEKR